MLNSYKYNGEVSSTIKFVHYGADKSEQVLYNLISLFLNYIFQCERFIRDDKERLGVMLSRVEINQKGKRFLVCTKDNHGSILIEDKMLMFRNQEDTELITEAVAMLDDVIKQEKIEPGE